MQIQLCRFFGGHEEVHTTQTGSGFQAVWVICHGGALDGMDCATGPGPGGVTSDCIFPASQSREVIQIPSKPPLPEPVVKDGASEQPVVVETPLIPEPTSMPQPEPTEEIVTEEPVVDDGSVDEPAPPVEATPEPEAPVVDDGAVVDNPVVSDEPTVKDPDPGPSKGEPGIRDPNILDDIPPIEEPIILT